MTIPRSLRKVLSQMEQKKGSGQLGLKMVDYLKVTMQMVKKMPLGQVGGIMKEQKKKCKAITKMEKMVDKWFFYDKNGNLKEIRYFSPNF